MDHFTFVLSHFGLVGVLSFLSYLIGWRIARRVEFHSVWEEISTCAGLGLGMLGLILFVLGVLDLLRLQIVSLVLAVLGGFCFAGWVGHFPARRICEILKQNRLPILVAVLVAGLGWSIWMMPLYPPTAFDSTLYHLAWAKHFHQHHSLVLSPYIRFPLFPQLVETLFTLGLMLHDDILAQLLSFLMLVVLAASVVGFGSAHWSRRAGWWGAALLCGNPLVLWLGSVGYVDIGLAMYVTLATHAFWNWLRRKQTGWLILSGAFCGFAMDTKYSGVLLTGVFLAVCLYVGARKKTCLPALALLASALLIASPWYVRNLYHSGNPVWPFFPQVFGCRIWSQQDIQNLMASFSHYGPGRDLWTLVTLPWQITFAPQAFHVDMGAALSPVYLFLSPLAVFFGFKDRWIGGLLLLVVAFTLAWFGVEQILRLLAPALPLLSLATAASLDRFLRWLASRWPWCDSRAVLAIGTAAFVFPGWLYATREWNNNPLPVTANARERFLGSRLPAYPAIQFLNQHHRSDYAVYGLFAENLTYFADGTFMGDWHGTARYSRVLDKLGNARALFEELRQLGADHFLVSNEGTTIALPADEFFRNHFQLVYGRARVSLFRLVTQGLRFDLSPELLRNGGFEIADQQLAGWKTEGSPGIDRSGKESHSGQVAVLGLGCNNVAFQPVAIRPNAPYNVSFYARASQAGQRTRLQIKWNDLQDRFLSGDIQVTQVDQHWNHYEMIVTSPPDAATAVIYASPHEQDEVWYDDFSFRLIAYDRGSDSDPAGK